MEHPSHKNYVAAVIAAGMHVIVYKKHLPGQR